MDTLRVKELILDHVDPGMRPGIPGTQPARELQGWNDPWISGGSAAQPVPSGVFFFFGSV